jgi:small subunit ribosomal protein S20
MNSNYGNISRYQKGYLIMANIKSQKKRNLTNEKARVANSSSKSTMRTAIKDVKTAVESKNLESSIACLNKAVSLIDKAVSAGRLTKNTAARKKSNLGKLVDTIR